MDDGKVAAGPGWEDYNVAARVRAWQSVALVVLMELGCAYWIRDNLTLNVVMLIHPVEAIERWQLAGKRGVAPMEPVQENPRTKVDPAFR